MEKVREAMRLLKEAQREFYTYNLDLQWEIKVVNTHATDTSWGLPREASCESSSQDPP